MKIIVGLGNPGKRYARTRHNAGFMVIDGLARNLNIDVLREKADSLIGTGRMDGQEVVLAKPQTFMNESGRAVGALLRASYASPDDLLVIHDDLDLSPGAVRVKKGGGHGGHNGLRSIIEATGSSEFIRIRIGIGRPGPGIEPADYVLSPFLPDERDIALRALEDAAGAVTTTVLHGITQAMNQFNQK